VPYQRGRLNQNGEKEVKLRGMIFRDHNIPYELKLFFGRGGRTAGYWLDIDDNWVFPFITPKELSEEDIYMMNNLVEEIMSE